MPPLRGQVFLDRPPFSSRRPFVDACRPSMDDHLRAKILNQLFLLHFDSGTATCATIPIMDMDRPLTDEQIWRRRARRAAPVIGFSLAAGLAAAVLPGWVAPSFERRNLLLSTVDTGPVEAGISGAGVIEPLTEHVLFSPVDAAVRRILRQPGDPVAPREVVFHLDVSHLRRDLEQRQGEIDLLANRRTQTGTEHQQQMDDLQIKLRMTRLSADALAVKARQTREMLEFGGVSKNALGEIELDRKRVSLELEQLQRQQTRHGSRGGFS